MKKIGIDARIYSSKFTGIGRYVFEIVKRLPLLAPDMQFVIFLGEKEFSSFKESSNVQKVLAPERHYSFAEQVYFLKKLNKANLDLVHFPHFNAPIFYRKKLLVTIHDLILHSYPGRNLLNRLAYQLVISRVTRKAEKIISVSNYTKQDIKKLLGIEDQKIKVIYNGIDSFGRKISEAERQKFLEQFKIKKYLLYTGVHREHKNLSRLIEAFALVCKKHRDIHLVITGKKDDKYQGLYQKVDELKLGEKVLFTGFLDEEKMPLLLGCASLFVFPSLYEGFGFPPLEAMSASVPVVASNQTSIPEVCGEAALYFDPFDIEDISRQILSVLERGDLASSLIKKGRERVEKFSWEVCAKETLESYQESIFA